MAGLACLLMQSEGLFMMQEQYCYHFNQIASYMDVIFVYLVLLQWHCLACSGRAAADRENSKRRLNEIIRHLENRYTVTEPVTDL